MQQYVGDSMTKLDPILFPVADGNHPAGAAPITVLAVGSPEYWMDCGFAAADRGQLVVVEFEELMDSALAIHDPQMVVTPVVARGFDCIDVAAILSGFGFRGAYRAVTRRLPNPEIVRREVQAAYPGLDFDIVTVSADEQLSV